MTRAKFTLRLPREDLAVVTAAAKKLGMTTNDFIRARAVGDVRESDLEARIRAAVAADMAAMRGEVLEHLAALDARLKSAFTQLHKAIAGGKQQ